MSIFYLTIFIKHTFYFKLYLEYIVSIDELVLSNGSPRWTFEVNTIAIYVRGRLSHVSRVTSKHPWVWIETGSSQMKEHPFDSMGSARPTRLGKNKHMASQNGWYTSLRYIIPLSMYHLYVKIPEEAENLLQNKILPRSWIEWIRDSFRTKFRINRFSFTCTWDRRILRCGVQTLANRPQGVIRARENR